jgi:hypothetical protein
MRRVTFDQVSTGEAFFYEGHWWIKTHRLGGRREVGGVYIYVDLFPNETVQIED